MSWRKPSPGSAVGIVLETVRQLVANHVLQIAAAMAYYSALSLAPLVIITFGVAGLVVDRELLQRQMVDQLQRALGPDGAELLRDLATEERLSGTASWATAAGAAMLVFGGSAVFVQLQEGLNLIWGAPPGRHRSVLLFLRTRLISMAMVFCLGAVLLASMLANTFVAAVGQDLDDLVGASTKLAVLVQLGSSFSLTTTLFALLFKWLPEAYVTWRQAWAGGLLSGLLFHLGTWAIGQYIAHAAVGSAYGAAGSIVIVLVWVYYVGLIMFTGAQFARVLAQRPAPGESEVSPPPPPPPAAPPPQASSVPRQRQSGAGPGTGDGVATGA